MKINRVVGFALLLVVLKFLVPQIFGGIQNVLLSLFSALQFAMQTSKGVMQAGAGSGFMPPHTPSVGGI